MPYDRAATRRPLSARLDGATGRAEREVFIKGSKDELLRPLVAIGGGKSAETGVQSSILKWRTGWDSNPRYAFTYTRVPGVRLKPLGHLSIRRSASAKMQIVGTAAIYTDEFSPINPNLTVF